VATRNYKTGAPTTNKLQNVLDHWPFFPDQAIILDLQKEVWKWEDLVPLFMAVQRGLREKEAWLTMMSFWTLHLSTKPLSITPVQPARIGVWLNGATKADALWLLRVGVIPVYVIHMFIEGLDFPSPSLSKTILDRCPPINKRLHNSVM
jgi:hypothetical protein